MTREILIYRHGQAEDDSPDGDLGRELTDKGKRNAQRMGVWLARNGHLPDHVVASPAERALNTAHKTVKSAGLNADMVIEDDRLYVTPASFLLDVLKTTPEDAGRVMIIGHNPGFEDLLVGICANAVPTTDGGKILLAGTLVRVEYDGAWADLGSKCATCAEVVHPKSLPKTFPFPGPDGPGERPRPAYYYRQSSVIPYRRNAGGIEVLVVSSSGGKRWVVPKGIHDPGKTAQVSAAIEAREEAGVTGEVAEAPLGTYDYEKWDAICTVTVYPMEVTNVLSEDEWEENHRGRRWLSVEDAAALVWNEDVKTLIGKLPDALAP